MKSFHLQIVTPTGVCFDGESHEVSVRTIDGGVSILANHIPYVTALGDGRCAVYCEDGMREADCSGGMLTVVISGIPYPEEGVPVPEPEPEPEQDPNSTPLDGTNDSQQTGTGDQGTGDQGTGDQVSADVFN